MSSNPRIVSLVLSATLFACGRSPEASFSAVDTFRFVAPVMECEQPVTIEDKLACIPGLTFKEETTGQTPADYRLFKLEYTQPLDHAAPNGASFKQSLVLFHLDETAPLVLQTSGYQIFGVSLTTLARTLRANQIQVEHRFFGNSKPEPLDWSKLTIEQSAADFHRITLALKQIYAKGWVNTGASKGGMTSVYHKRFYPDDLTATVSLVAPLSYSTFDERYIGFVDAVGGDRYTECRAKLEAFQQAILRNRQAIAQKIDGSYQVVGSAAIALEHAVVELPFIFWQYGNPESGETGCDAIPTGEQTPDKLYTFMQRVSDVEEYFSDKGIEPFVSYFYQAANQLGGPGSKLGHIRADMDHEETYKLSTYLPGDAEVAFDQQAMPSVQDWVLNSSERIIFVYGEFDPWTAGAFAPRRGAGDNFFYTVPRGNHGANIFLLPHAEKQEALNKLSQWLDISLDQDQQEPLTNTLINTPATGHQSVRYLEEIEFEARRKGRL